MSPYLHWGLVAAALLVGAALAVFLLRRAWAERGPRRPWLIGAGWAVIAIVILVPTLLMGGAQGPFVAMTLVSFAAYAAVARNVQFRTSRARAEKSLAPEPSDRPSRAWRGWLRAGLAGPIGMVAALGIAIAYVTLVPGSPQTRIVTGGLMIPVLWGGAMAWTLADDKILRATAVLVGAAILGFGAAALKGFT